MLAAKAKWGTITREGASELFGTEITAAEFDQVTFLDPGTGERVTRRQYLSGDVRTKLEQATKAACTTPGLSRNIEALEKVIPATATSADISVRIGANWVPAELMNEWVNSVFERPVGAISFAQGLGWDCELSAFGSANKAINLELGTERYSAINTVNTMMAGKAIVVYDPVDDKKRVVNVDETVAANAKAEELHQRFETWLLHEDPERAAAICDIYTERFRRFVKGPEDQGWVKPQGLADGITLRPSQAAAVSQILDDGRALLAHSVGAGKTGVMATAALEGKRLGRWNRPVMVVPNHLLQQTTSEVLRWYPSAKVLMPTAKETDKAGRKELAIRCASDDWDLVVMPQSLFGLIPVSAATQREFTERHLDEMQSAIAGAEDRTFKQATKMIEREKAKLEAQLDIRRDDGPFWEQLAVDRPIPVVSTRIRPFVSL